MFKPISNNLFDSPCSDYSSITQGNHYRDLEWPVEDHIDQGSSDHFNFAQGNLCRSLESPTIDLNDRSVEESVNPEYENISTLRELNPFQGYPEDESRICHPGFCFQYLGSQFGLQDVPLIEPSSPRSNLRTISPASQFVPTDCSMVKCQGTLLDQGYLRNSDATWSWNDTFLEPYPNVVSVDKARPWLSKTIWSSDRPLSSQAYPFEQLYSPRSASIDHIRPSSLKCPRCPDKSFSLPRDLR